MLTNPKDLAGSLKVPLGLLPAAGKILGALAAKDGADKYGPYNWRDQPIHLTYYLDALERHLLALRDGEDLDPKSGLPHLGHIIATASIIADACECGTLIDDRPIAGHASDMLAHYTKQETGIFDASKLQIKPAKKRPARRSPSKALKRRKGESLKAWKARRA